MTPSQENWIVWTARVAVVLYLAALWAWYRSAVAGSGDEHQREWRKARRLWTAGGLIFIFHVGLAFQFLHHWSHDSAYQHTAQRTEEAMGMRVGGGIFVNYLFLLWWLFDIELLWISPELRGRWYRRITHAFFAFILINATLVFGPPWWRMLSLPLLLTIWFASRHWQLTKSLTAVGSDDTATGHGGSIESEN
jgi:hypothetical protein